MQKNKILAPILMAASMLLCVQSQALGAEKVATQEPFGGAPVQGKSSRGVVLAVGIPAPSVSQSPNHAYRPGFERALLKAVCVGGVRCQVRELDVDPRDLTKPVTRASRGVPGGLDVMVWGGDIRLSEVAQNSALTGTMDTFFESGGAAKLKTSFMRLNEPWPKPLIVATNRKGEAQAREICKRIKAACTFQVSNDTQGQFKRFDAGEINLVLTDNFLFESKDLEDRITTAAKDLLN